jgi:hypothetical protein
MVPNLQNPIHATVIKFVLLYFIFRKIFGIISSLELSANDPTYYKTNELVLDIVILVLWSVILLFLGSKNSSKEIASVSIIPLGAILVFGYVKAFGISYIFPSFSNDFVLSLVAILLMSFLLFSPHKLMTLTRIPLISGQLPKREVIYKIGLSTIFIFYAINSVLGLIIDYFLPKEPDLLHSLINNTKYDYIKMNIAVLGVIMFLLFMLNPILKAISKQEEKSRDYLVVFIRLFFFWLFVDNIYFLFVNLVSNSGNAALLLTYAIILLAVIYPNHIALWYHTIVENKQPEHENNFNTNTIEDLIGFVSLFFIAVNVLNFLFFSFGISQFALMIFGAHMSIDDDFQSALQIVLINSAFAFLVFKIRHKIARYYGERLREA